MTTERSLFRHAHKADAWSTCPPCKAAGRYVNEAAGERAFAQRLRDKADTAERMAAMCDERAQEALKRV